MSGYVGDLSTKQEEVLGKFRTAIQDVLKPGQGDSFLLRWLRARDFDAKKAESMLRDAVKWRKEIGADTILDEYQPTEVIDKYHTGGFVGFDKSGCPIFIDLFGFLDMKGLLRSAKKQDIVRHYVHVLETVDKLCKEQSKTGSHVEQVTAICDFKSFGVKHMWKPAVDMYLTIVEVAESRYPEVLRKAFVINSPKIFPLMWSIVRPLMHENTAKKVVVLSSNYQEALLKEIDKDQLPVCYGGTLSDPDGDPRCKQRVCQGGIVPKEFYNQAIPHVTMTSTSIGRGSTLQLEYEVHESNSVLRYEFLTDNHDVGFGVFRKNTKERLKAGDMETILTTQRSNCHLVPEDGAVICDIPGIYVVRFDNTYSWARSKKIHYLIEVLEPESKCRSQQNKKHNSDNLVSDSKS